MFELAEKRPSYWGPLETASFQSLREREPLYISTTGNYCSVEIIIVLESLYVHISMCPRTHTHTHTAFLLVDETDGISPQEVSPQEEDFDDEGFEIISWPVTNDHQ